MPLPCCKAPFGALQRPTQAVVAPRDANPQGINAMPEKAAPGCECVPYRRGAFAKRFMRDSTDINSVAQADFLGVNPAKAKSLIEGPRALFLCIAKSLVLLRLRRKNERIKRYVEDSAAMEVVGERLSEHALSVTETLRMHCEAVAELSNPCRQIYLLRKAHGLSHKKSAHTWESV